MDMISYVTEQRRAEITAAEQLDRRACALILFGQTVEAGLLIAEATRIRKAIKRRSA